MKTIVYVDMLFLVNFLINMILLKITEIFTRNKGSFAGMCFASLLGAIYAVCMFFPQINFLYIFPVKLAVSVIMIRMHHPKIKLIKTIRYCAVFYLVSFTFAGILLALIYFTDFADNASPTINNGIFYFDVSLWTLIASSAFAYIIIKIASAVFLRNKLLGIRLLKISLAGRECNMPALSDTGNLLTDPVSNSSVIIAEKNQLKTLFPDGIPDFECTFESEIRLRAIPYSSLGTDGGMMLGFVPDSIYVDGKPVCNVVVGISEKALSSTNEYNALFNPNILNQNRRL